MQLWLKYRHSFATSTQPNNMELTFLRLNLESIFFKIPKFLMAGDIVLPPKQLSLVANFPSKSITNLVCWSEIPVYGGQ